MRLAIRARKYSRKVGSPPGSLILTGEPRADRTTVSVLDFDEIGVKEISRPLGELSCLRGGQTVSWIDVEGLVEVEKIRELGQAFGLHPMMLEDILNTGQRPKVEEFGDHIYLVLKMIRLDGEGEIQSEQVSMVLGDGYLITFQEAPGDVFDHVRERIRTGKGRVRRMGASYLAYALMDSIVDNYFLVLEKMGDRMEGLDALISGGSSPQVPGMINELKGEMIFLRRSSWPLREMVNGLMRSEAPYLDDGLTVFLRDLYDHVVEISETVETLRDVLSGLLDLHMSLISNRMNEIMKTLTIIATTFIPLTFVAGVYGMNFAHMPELSLEWAYPAVWGVMIAIVIIMIIYFRRKGWL
ncbi:MAG: magnesium/cobalt transporter CorA [Methanomassiliicoccales archaeon]